MNIKAVFSRSLIRRLKSKMSVGVPSHDGFYMPGEFKTHQRCWLAWPYRPDVWRNNAKNVQQSFVDLVSKIAQFEPVTVLVSKACWNAAHREFVEIPDVDLKLCDTNDAWVRDTGTTFLVHKEHPPRGVDWRFNAWGGVSGGCLSDWSHDDAVAGTMLDSLNMFRYRAPLVLEGGSIHVDGEGTLITTEECLLHPNRNPDLSQEQIETLLKAYTGSSKVIWLKHGVFGDDDTNGHVDNLCFFVRPGHVALTWTDDPTDPQHARRSN
jgi:agmatine deiminase